MMWGPNTKVFIVQTPTTSVSQSCTNIFISWRAAQDCDIKKRVALLRDNVNCQHITLKCVMLNKISSCSLHSRLYSARYIYSEFDDLFSIGSVGTVELRTILKPVYSCRGLFLEFHLKSGKMRAIKQRKYTSVIRPRWM